MRAIYAGATNQRSVQRGQVSVLGFVRMALDPLLIAASLVICTYAFTGTYRAADLVLGLLVFAISFPGDLPVTPGMKGLLREILSGWAVVVFTPALRRLGDGLYRFV